MVFPLSGSGGRLAAQLTAQTGRLPAVMPALVCGASITSFDLDPFNPLHLAVSGDDSQIRVFHVPDHGLKEDFSETSAVLKGELCNQITAGNLLSMLDTDARMDKITEVLFSPTVADLLLSTSADSGNSCIRLWNLQTQTVIQQIYIADGVRYAVSLLQPC